MAVLAVFIGGALGSVVRAAVGLIGAGALGPWPTVVINIVGCLAIGLFAGWLVGHPSPRGWWQPLLATGFLGGFTTMSAYAVHTLSLYSSGQTAASLIYACLTLVGSIAAAAVGFRVSAPAAP